MNTLGAALRCHLPFLLVIPLLIIAMTFPAIQHILPDDEFWLVQHNIDANMLLWDAWYFERLMKGRADYYFTDLLFYPQGVSLAFHNFSLPHMALMTALKTILPADSAFNLSYLLLSFTTTAAGYLYMYYLFRDSWLALFGCVVFGLCGFVLARPAQIHISFIAPIPLALYCLHRAINEDSRKFMLLAGGIIGATAFVGLYTLVCLLIIIGCFVLGFAFSRWRSPHYWLAILLLIVTASAVAFPRVYPMLRDAAELSGALAKNEGIELGTDLMWYFVPYKHPLLGPLLTSALPIVDKPGWDRVVYLGYIPLALLALALFKRRTRSAALPWLGLALIFLTLRLGSTLTFNSTNYPNILLPKHYLEQILPAVFKAFWTPDAFLSGALLPLAALSCLGLSALLHSIPGRARRAVILILALAAAFEYYQAQIPYTQPPGRLDFIDWLRQEDDPDSIHLINLPMGGQSSKVYAYYQSFNGYPHAEGRPTRTPTAAFAYIDDNLLLREWRAGKSYNCLPGNQAEFRAAQSQLLADGFTHIVLHRDRLYRETIAANFSQIPTAYSDDQVSVYRLADLDESCALSALMSQDARAQLAAIAETTVLPWASAALLSIQPNADAAAILLGMRGHTSLQIEGSQILGSQVRGDDNADAESAFAASDIILFTADRSTARQETVATYRQWIKSQFDSCGSLSESDRTVIEVFLRSGYPCQLAIADSPLAIDYYKGIQLGNMLVRVAGDQLELHLLWTQLPADAHAVSIQLFDETGVKALGQDLVFHRSPLVKQRIGLASLKPGEYSMKMIVYNYETGASLPGTVISSQERFDRELEIMTLTVD